MTVDTPVPLTHRQVLTILSGLLLGMFLAAIDQTIVATSLPTIVQDLGGLDSLSWVVTAYLITSTASTPLYGKLSDLYGRRLVFQFAIAVFLAGSVLSGLSQSMGQLVVFRGIQGLGGGGLIAMAFAVIGDVLSPRDRGRYMGYFSAMFALAGIAGPLLGGLFTDHLSWRWIFYVNVPIGLVAFVVTSVSLRLPVQNRARSIDYFGALVLVASVVSLLLVSAWGGDAYGWISAPIVGLFGVGLALLAVFVWWEARVPEPILPPRLFRNRTVAVSFAVAALSGGALLGASVFLPLFLQAVAGASATNSGLLLAPLMLSLTVASVFAGRRISRTGRYRRLLLAGVSVGVAGMALLSTLDSGTSRFSVSVFMVVVGVGMGMSMPVLNLATQNAVPFEDLGTATSAITFARSLGGAFGVAAFGAVMTSRLHSRLTVLLGDVDVDRIANGPAQIRRLAEPLRSQVIDALGDAIGGVYLVALPIMVVAALVALWLPELPLRARAYVEFSGDGQADTKARAVQGREQWPVGVAVTPAGVDEPTIAREGP